MISSALRKEVHSEEWVDEVTHLVHDNTDLQVEILDLEVSRIYFLSSDEEGDRLEDLISISEISSQEWDEAGDPDREMSQKMNQKKRRYLSMSQRRSRYHFSTFSMIHPSMSVLSMANTSL